MELKMALNIKDLTLSFYGLKALDSLSFQIEEQSITAIIGPNGSGKTTLLNTISGFLKPDAGEIYFKGQNITHLAPYKVSKIGIGRTFQVLRLFPQLTVMENMLIALGMEKKEGVLYGINPFVRHSNIVLEEKADKLLSLVGLQSKVNEYAGNLSHGQRRLLEILRVVAINPDLYLFDEPTAGVFPELRTKILEIFRFLKNEGSTIIFVEHDMDAVRNGAERVIVLDAGKIIADGKPDVILESEPVIKAYFGG